MWEKLTYRLNTFCDAHVLYVGKSGLLLYAGDGMQGLSDNSLNVLGKKPLILVIETSQFLQIDQSIEHIDLSDYQGEILKKIEELPLILCTVLFLPSLITKTEDRAGFSNICFLGKNYLYFQCKGVVFSVECSAENISTQIQECCLYLKRFQFSDADLNVADVEKENLIEIEIINKCAIRSGRLNAQLKDNEMVSRLISKQESGQLYRRVVCSIFSVIGGMLGIAFLLLWLNLDIFLRNHPWGQWVANKSFSEEERSKLNGFKKYLDFEEINNKCDLDKLRAIFNQFPEKIVATDVNWGMGKWKVALIINPHYLHEKSEILQWIDSNMTNSKVVESGVQESQFYLEFEG